MNIRFVRSHFLEIYFQICLVGVNNGNMLRKINTSWTGGVINWSWISVWKGFKSVKIQNHKTSIEIELKLGFMVHLSVKCNCLAGIFGRPPLLHPLAENPLPKRRFGNLWFLIRIRRGGGGVRHFWSEFPVEDPLNGFKFMQNIWATTSFHCNLNLFCIFLAFIIFFFLENIDKYETWVDKLRLF